MVIAPGRILFVLDDLVVGGVSRVAVDLIHSLCRRGWLVGVAASEEPCGLWHELPESVVRYYAPDRAGLGGNWRYIVWLRRILKESEWQILHTHQRGVSISARIAAFGTRASIVEHVHNTFCAVGVGRWLSFRGHHLIACGSAVYDMLCDSFGRPPKVISLIPNVVRDEGDGVDLGLPSAKVGAIPKILGIGRLAPQKDPFRFMDVIRKLNELEQVVQAEWVGDGPMLDAVVESLQARPIRGLQFSGESANSLAKILSADLVLLTSRWEGLPLVLLEAMSLGRAIAAPDVGSCKDVIEQRANGLLYDPSLTADGIAALISTAISESQLVSWGRRSRELFLERPGPEDMAIRVESVYRRLIRR